MPPPKESKGILLESGTNEVEFLRFTISSENYGINVGKVRQIVEFKNYYIVPPPEPTPGVVGTTKYREKAITIINLQEVLGLAPSTADSVKRLILICEFNNYTCGLLMDSVLGITRCSWQDFHPMAQTSLHKGPAAVVGVITVKEQMYPILDIESIIGMLVPETSIEHFSDQVQKTLPELRQSVRVLYCEDSPTVQRMVMKTLTEAGYKSVQVCANGADGVNYIETHGAQNIDLIISDIEMPKMDGLAFCKAVRARPELKTVPFVFFSSMVNSEMQEKCSSVGGDAAFSKPQIHEIVAKIDKLLGERLPQK
ncbi:MAG: chemotaxis protein [Oligoflexia bacterium]|nr:chemotaxis protein [Oligoflexia bacterium]